eukprot:4209213-Amphidinium_carterae.1
MHPFAQVSLGTGGGSEHGRANAGEHGKPTLPPSEGFDLASRGENPLISLLLYLKGGATKGALQQPRFLNKDDIIDAKGPNLSPLPCSVGVEFGSRPNLASAILSWRCVGSRPYRVPATRPIVLQQPANRVGVATAFGCLGLHVRLKSSWRRHSLRMPWLARKQGAV